MADAQDAGGEPEFQPDPKAKLMQEVAEQMDAIESDFPEGFEIGRVITIVEVRDPDGTVGIRIRAGMYPWVALGVLEFAKKQIEQALAE